MRLGFRRRETLRRMFLPGVFVVIAACGASPQQGTPNEPGEREVLDNEGSQGPTEGDAGSSESSSAERDASQADQVVLATTPMSYRMDKKVYFGRGMSTLDEDGKHVLDTLVFSLNATEYVNHVHIQGHADSREGDTKTLERLSVKRARAAYDYLLKKGVEKERISFAGYSDACPREGSSPEESEDMSRRVDFQILVIDGVFTGRQPACPAAAERGLVSKEIRAIIESAKPAAL